MTSPSTSLNPPSVRPPAWNLPNLVLWGRYALVLLMLGLVFFAQTFADLTALYVLFSLLLVGSIYLVWLVIRQAPAGRIRWASLWFVASLLASLLRVVLRAWVFGIALDPSDPLIAGSSTLLYVLSNLCIIVSIALFLPVGALTMGNTLRAVLGSMVIGCATLVGVLNMPTLGTMLGGVVFRATNILTPSFTLAIAFAAVVLALRYGQSGGPLLIFGVSGVVCLLVGNLISMAIVIFAPDQALIPFLLSPLFALVPVLSSHGIYRSIERPPQFTPPDAGRPNNDWLFWSMLPRASAVVALLVAVASGQVLLPLLLVLGVVWLGHELVSFVDAQRMVQQLARSPQARDG